MPGWRLSVLSYVQQYRLCTTVLDGSLLTTRQGLVAGSQGSLGLCVRSLDVLRLSSVLCHLCPVSPCRLSWESVGGYDQRDAS